MKSMRVDLKAECAAAWAVLWAKNIAQRNCTDPERMGGDWRGQTYYLTTTDLERHIREKLSEQFYDAQRASMTAEEWRKAPYRKFQIRGAGPGGLHNFCLRWLLDQERRGVLASHNFGRGHISGQRFRPVGEPISDAEKGTLVVKAKERQRDYVKDPLPVHAGLGKFSTGRPLCAFKPGHWFSYRRSTARVRAAKDRAKVTCRACLKLISPKSALSPADEARMVSLTKSHERIAKKDGWRAIPEAERKELLQLQKRVNAQKFGREKKEDDE